MSLDEFKPAPQATPTPAVKKGLKQKMAAVLLAALCGAIGAHKFYLRRYGQGILFLLIFPLGAFIGIAEAIIFYFMPQEVFDTKFNAPATPKKTEKTTAAMLAILCGSFGLHRFYLREVWWGILYLVLSLIGFIWGFRLFLASGIYDQALAAYAQTGQFSMHGASMRVAGMWIPSLFMTIPAIAGFVEGIYLMSMDDERFEAKYGSKR